MGRPVGVAGLDLAAGALVDLARRERAHRDRVGHRADRHAQVAADALLFLDLEVAFAVPGRGDRLVRGVFAHHVAAAALDARAWSMTAFSMWLRLSSFQSFTLPTALPRNSSIER